MKKWLSNLSLRAKIFILATPLTLALIISVVINTVQVSNTSKSLENIYFKTLYEVNNYLLNADRDYYQALCGATSYYNFTNGFTDATPELIAMIKDGYLDNYKENLDQVEDRVKKAIAIAKTNDALFTGTRHVDENGKEGKTFKEVYAQFESDYSDWKKTFNVEGNTGDWSSFNTVFDTVRENLNQMQEITEKWATDQSKALSRNTQSGIVMTIIVFSILIIALLVFTLYITQLIRKSADATRSNIDKLASGDLRVKFADDSEIGSDELGSIEKSAKFLCNKLVEVMTTSNTMANQLSESGSDLASSANQASQASDQVTSAVSEIAKGAVSQADNVRSASNNTENIGSNIETIVDNVKEMDAVATDMKSACDNAMDSLDKLIRQSAEVTHSVKEIGDTINSTNDSAKKISEFTQAITDISAQTNLLSLNASIEAARAGDAGRGFAVVADEIRQLADQSKESADKIKGIVEQLLADSASSVSVLEKLNESFGMQAAQLESTKSTMEVMNGNVSSVRESSASISKRVASLDDAKNDLTNIVADLSAISEENAASTEETNASMEELNSTFTIITDSAAKLQTLAKDMTDTISFFKL